MDGVKEYMKYGIVGGNYFSVDYNKKSPDYNYRIPLVLEAEGDLAAGSGSCKVAFVSDYKYDFTEGLYSDLLTGGALTAAILGVYEYDYQLEEAYNASSPSEINIHSLLGYFPPAFWTTVGDKFDTADFREFFCHSIESSCNDVWLRNGYQPASVGAPSSASLKSWEDVEELPLTDADGGWKEASMGCRQMHLSFVLDGNVNHCPHISEKSMKDSNGNIKCQDDTYEGFTAETIFTPEQLFIANFIGQNFFGYDSTLVTEYIEV